MTKCFQFRFNFAFNFNLCRYIKVRAPPEGEPSTPEAAPQTPEEGVRVEAAGAGEAAAALEAAAAALEAAAAEEEAAAGVRAAAGRAAAVRAAMKGAGVGASPRVWGARAVVKAKCVEDDGAWQQVGPRRGRHHRQGLTLVHSSAQLEHFVWDRGCPEGLCSTC